MARNKFVFSNGKYDFPVVNEKVLMNSRMQSDIEKITEDWSRGSQIAAFCRIQNNIISSICIQTAQATIKNKDVVDLYGNCGLGDITGDWISIRKELLSGTIPKKWFSTVQTCVDFINLGIQTGIINEEDWLGGTYYENR